MVKWIQYECIDNHCKFKQLFKNNNLIKLKNKTQTKFFNQKKSFFLIKTA